MSRLSVGQLRGLPANSNVIEIPSGHTLDVQGTLTYRSVPNQVRQVIYVRTDTRTTYAANNSENGTTISDLSISVTPQFANSLLIIQWMINGEVHQDSTILIHKNNSLITESGVEGYNQSLGNIRSSGYTSGAFDNDTSSTPSNYFVQYSIVAGSTSSMSFAPAVRSSGASNYTFALNRTVSGATTDNQESMVSSGVLWEIAQ